MHQFAHAHDASVSPSGDTHRGNSERRLTGPHPGCIHARFLFPGSAVIFIYAEAPGSPHHAKVTRQDRKFAVALQAGLQGLARNLTLGQTGLTGFFLQSVREFFAKPNGEHVVH